MQKWFLKIQKVLVILFALPLFAEAQTSLYRLHTADSLFEKKQYTQSIGHYEAILKNNEYSPAMFLKMAYIYEGLGNIGRALHYLTLYQETSGDRSTHVKMRELAQKFQLEGYETSDADLFLTWYHNAYAYITYALTALCVFLLTLAFRQKFKKQSRPIGTAIAIVIAGILFVVHLYYGEKISSGIIADGNTFIMAGPSPGSNVVERVGEGHRIDVIGQQDVWLKVRWRGDVAFVKENGVLRSKL